MALHARDLVEFCHTLQTGEWTRQCYLARLGLPAVSHEKNFPESHIINPLLTKFVRSRWLDIGLVLFLRVYWTSTSSRSIKNDAKKELAQYPAILTSHLANNPHTFIGICSMIRPARVGSQHDGIVGKLRSRLQYITLPRGTLLYGHPLN